MSDNIIFFNLIIYIFLLFEPIKIKDVYFNAEQHLIYSFDYIECLTRGLKVKSSVSSHLTNILSIDSAFIFIGKKAYNFYFKDTVFFFSPVLNTKTFQTIFLDEKRKRTLSQKEETIEKQAKKKWGGTGKGRINKRIASCKQTRKYAKAKKKRKENKI